MQIPTEREIRALHRRYAPSREAYDLVYTHCEIVCGIAEQILSCMDIDLNEDLIRAGSLLHDVGVYRLYDAAGRVDHANYVRHGILGHELLSEEGYPDSICRFCSCHTGVGLRREDIQTQGLPLPLGDYLAETGEEELVMYADKFHSKTDPPVFVTAASYATYLQRFGEDKVTAFKAMCEKYGEPDLDPFLKMYGHSLV